MRAAEGGAGGCLTVDVAVTIDFLQMLERSR
jgi:hypothetical protein